MTTSIGPGCRLLTLFDKAARSAWQEGKLEIVRESEFWARLGLVDAGGGSAALYAGDAGGVAACADRGRAAVAPQGALRASREVRRLPYFDFEEVRVARKLSQLFASGCSLALIDRKLDELARLCPRSGRCPTWRWWSRTAGCTFAAARILPSRAGNC